MAEKMKAKEDAPNYRESEFEDKLCSNCRFNEEGFCTLFEFDWDKGFICDAWESIEIKGKAIELARPHGFLIWREKQTAIANDEPLPVGEPLTVVSAGEAYGTVTLSEPTHMTPSFFDKEEQAEQHCVYASERRLWWPKAEALYMHRFETWEPFDRSVPADVKEGRVVFRQPDRLSKEEKELINVSKTLPKTISLESLMIAVNTKDPTQISAPDNIPWELKTALSRVLKSTFQREAIYVDKAHFDHIPLYEVALVRSPRIEVRRFGGEAEEDPVGDEEKGPPWEVVERDGKQCVVKVEDGKVVQCYEGTGAHERALKLLAALNINVEENASGHHDEDEDHEDEDEEKQEYDEDESGIEDEKRRWTRKFINDLPDSHFLYIESGGELDEERKTKPRRLRHFPFKDSARNIDLPHLRNSIARIPQSKDKDGKKLSDSLVTRLQREAREMLEKENEKRGKSFEALVRSAREISELSPEEEEKVGRRLRKSWIERLKDFGDLIKDLLHWAQYQEIDNAKTKEFDTPSGFALKEVDGQTWYFTWTTNAFEDRQEEIFSTKSLEQYVKEASEKEERGFFNFWHIEGTDFARKEWQAVVGRFLVEAGPFLENHAGKRALKFFKTYRDGHPDFAPEGWGSSPEFRFLPEERSRGYYDWIWIFRTSTLPRAAAANLWTKSGQEVKIMSLEGPQKEAAIALFGEEFVKKLIQDGEKRTQELEDSGVAHKQEVGQGTKNAEEFAKALMKLTDELADSAIKEQLTSFAEGLTDENLREQGEALQVMSEQLDDEKLRTGIRNIAEQMQAESEEVEEEESAADSPVPGVEEEKVQSFTIDQIVEALSSKMEKDFSPFAEALASLAVDINTITRRLEKMEKKDALKQNTEIPRFMLSMTRATEAEKTTIAEDDDLKNKRPREAAMKKGGSVADAFFGN